MDEETNRGCDASMEADKENSKPINVGEEEICGGGMEETDEQRQARSDCSSGCGVDNSSGGESKAGVSETLASVQLSEGHFQVDCDECSHNLSEVPVKYSLQLLESTGELKDQEKAEHKQPPGGNTDQSAQVLLDGSSKLELPPISVALSSSSNPTKIRPEQKLQPIENEKAVCPTVEEKQNLPDPKLSPAVFIAKPPADGYNWRKYGQKQVKSPEGSRSYYRCTFSDCYAKKIEFYDPSNCLVETVYRSHHNHDLPQKLNCARLSRALLPAVSVNRSVDTSQVVKCLNNSVPSPQKEPLCRVHEIPETKQQDSSDSGETMELDMKESVKGSECQRRKRMKYTGEVESSSTGGKKPKYIVHAAGDAVISGDGYRWRKYGQKMVKNNPHPRNYYRCTSAGCPVRKHIERDADNSRTVIITYNGVHDHNAPVPRKRHGLSSAPAITTSTAPVASDNLLNETKQCKNETDLLVDKDGQLSGEMVKESKEKSSESAKTLLSVGFEIKPC